MRDVVTVRWTAALLMWALTAALGLVDLIAIRESVVAVAVTLKLGHSALGLLDKCVLLLSAFAWLGGILYAQHMYSQAGSKGMGLRSLLVRFQRATVIELLILAAAVGVHVGIQWGFASVSHPR